MTGGARAVAEQVAEPGHEALPGVLLHAVLAQAVCGEEEELVVAPAVAGGAALLGGRPGRTGADEHAEHGDAGEHAGGSCPEPALIGSPRHDLLHLPPPPDWTGPTPSGGNLRLSPPRCCYRNEPRS